MSFPRMSSRTVSFHILQNDVGGEFLLEENWTTFMKARLNCSINEKTPFDFNELGEN